MNFLPFLSAMLNSFRMIRNGIVTKYSGLSGESAKPWISISKQDNTDDGDAIKQQPAHLIQTFDRNGLSGYNQCALGNRLAVGLRTLDPCGKVRILLPQPNF